MLFFSIVIFIGTCVLLAMCMEDEDYFISMAGITFFTLVFIQAPVQWVVFKRLARDHEALFVIQRELGRTEANIDLLRSQINPHFLFNTLNTLYGMAIHEKATRTSEGVEKLGSMMRFMLQENVQDMIPLKRELEYIENYISLQTLRTDINPRIKIGINIQQHIDRGLRIAPMLLIPFIENAFKHGISFRDESHIRFSLELKDNILHFDVFNTCHVRTENDPEKHSHFIGINNVKRRLQLLYPGKHELTVRESIYDYSVHLVIFLDYESDRS